MSGGPFFRDITSQGTNQNQQLSAYLFSGHSQSENFRPGLKLFSASFGQRPSELPDLSFIAGLDLPGYIAESRRGNLHGAVKGMGALQAGCGRSRDWYTLLRHTDTVSRVSEIHRDGPDLTLSRLDENDAHSEYTVVLSNQAAQYWADVDMDGAFAIDAALPGTYRMKLYHDQKEVASTVVTIAAGRTTGASIAAPTEPEVVWSIGCNDGRPHGFKNADRIERMHPSDPRMKKWEPTTFAVGSPVNQFPMAQIRSLNPTTIQFSLSADQATGARTLLISITASFAKGSPQITVNGEKQKVSSHPAAATFYGAPVYASRAFTRGSYLGIPTTYTFTSLPLKAGLNEILIDVASGASSSGRSPFLQPSFTYDYVALL
jgi:rhamnogalacturonan endolyase